MMSVFIVGALMDASPPLKVLLSCMACKLSCTPDADVE